MAYRLLISPAARRDLKGIRGPARRRIAETIDSLADDPRPQGYTKLAGADDPYRARVGDYQIVYKIEDDRLLVLVAASGIAKTFTEKAGKSRCKINK